MWGVEGGSIGLQKTYGGEKHQLFDDVVIGSDPMDCETDDNSVTPAKLVNAFAGQLSRKNMVMASKQNKIENEKLKIKDRARKRDKKHKVQKNFDRAAEQLDEHFSHFQGKLKSLPV